MRNLKYLRFSIDGTAAVLASNILVTYLVTKLVTPLRPLAETKAAILLLVLPEKPLVSSKGLNLKINQQYMC